MAFNFPNIDPVIIHIYGPLSINYYSLAYVIGIIGGWVYFKKINSKYKLGFEPKIIDDIITYVTIGIVLGGRIGYVLFYDFSYYLHHPIEIIATWRGGMSFHGGLIGIIIALYIISKKSKVKFIILLDTISCVTPIGIFFGRIANFINGELYGNYTNFKWGVIFPGEKVARHASQLYEAFFEGIIILIVQYFILSKTKSLSSPGILSAAFLFQYSIYRTIIEFFRMPDSNIGYINNLTMGQILSFPMIIISLILLFKNLKKNYGTKI